MKPLFSIILPSYNRSEMLKTAIESVMKQTVDNWELIVVDDGSTDPTKSVVESFKDERIRYVYQENQERSAARNNGIQLAQGQLICFLDSDDYYLPFHLETFQGHLPETQKKENLFLYSGFERMSEAPYQPKNEFEQLLLYPVSPPRVCVSKNLFSNEKFDPKLKLSEDTDLWLRILTAQPQVIPIQKETIKIVEHEGRSIRGNEKIDYLKNVDFAGEMYQLHRPNITSLATKIHQSNLLVTLATRTINDDSRFARKSTLKAFLKMPTHRTKEKIILMLASVGLKRIENH